MNIALVLGTGVADHVTLDATIDEGAVSGVYVRLFLPNNTDPRSNAKLHLGPVSVPVAVERFFQLPVDSAPRLEFEATAGDSGLAVSVQASMTVNGATSTPVTVTGVTPETLVLTLA